MDLDDMLDDVEIPDDEPETSTSNDKMESGKDSNDMDMDADLLARMEEHALLPFTSTLGNVPSSTKDKWVAMYKLDSKVIMPANKLLQSRAYRDWDAASKIGTNGVSRGCSEVVRNACVKCGFDDVKTAKISSLVSLQDGDAAMRLQKSFAAQLLRDLKGDISRDPNYVNDKNSFPGITSALAQV
jgi:hypothetical protein